MLPKYEASRNSIFRELKTRTKRKNIYFDLSFADFSRISILDCVYCGAKPSNNRKTCHNISNGAWKHNGLDRKDNKKGYIIDNVQPCCCLCNRLKSDIKEKEFLEHVSLIVSHVCVNKLDELKEE